jgi:hypothetical protein
MSIVTGGGVTWAMKPLLNRVQLYARELYRKLWMKQGEAGQHVNLQNKSNYSILLQGVRNKIDLYLYLK